MSHDFALWESNEPLEDAEALAIYLDLMNNGCSPTVLPCAHIALVAAELRARWPDADGSNVDECPWASPIDVSDAHLAVALVPSRLWDVWPFLGDLAKRYNLVMFDPQQEHVFLPAALSRMRTRKRAREKGNKA